MRLSLFTDCSCLMRDDCDVLTMPVTLWKKLSPLFPELTSSPHMWIFHGKFKQFAFYSLSRRILKVLTSSPPALAFCNILTRRVWPLSVRAYVRFFHCMRFSWLSEVPKTDKSFEERLIFKTFILKFVNAFTPIIYIAFFRGRFVSLYLECVILLL